MSNTPPNTPNSRLSPASAAPALHPQSCTLCSSRKVKCDRVLTSCANCIKNSTSCEYRAPQPRGPRKRKQNHEENDYNLHARIAKYEQVLRGLGISDPRAMPLDASEKFLPERTPRNPYELFTTGTQGKGRMMNEDGRQSYTENNLWELVADEVPRLEHDDSDDSYDDVHEAQHVPHDTMRSIEPGTDAESILLGLPGSSDDTRQQPPISIKLTKHQADRLWVAFNKNVYPIGKLLHAPTFHEKYALAAHSPHKTSKPTQALTAAIQYAGAMSLQPIDFESELGGTQKDMVPGLQSRCIVALTNAKCMSSLDIECLQAFILYTMTARSGLNPRALWNLAGVAIRIAQTMGLHSNAATLKFPPLEAEIRRRVWRDVCVLDGHSSELSGFTPSFITMQSDTGPPGNYNDADLTPSMSELPPERTGATDSMFMMARTAGGTFAKKNQLFGVFMTISKRQDPIPTLTEELDRKLDDMADMYEQNFLRYCDPIIPEHQLVTILVRVVLSRLRMKVHHPRRHEDPGKTMTQAERDIAFHHALRVVEYDILCLTTPSLRGFQWHMRSFFQWDGFIYVLSELRNRSVDEESTQAWDLVEQIYALHPEILEDHQKAIHQAVGCLCLKAWVTREKALQREDPASVREPPTFIKQLRDQHALRDARTKQQQRRSKKPIVAPKSKESLLYDVSTYDIDSSFTGSQDPNGSLASVSPEQWDMTQQYPMLNDGAGVGLTSEFDFTFDVTGNNPFSDNLFESANSSMMDWTGWDDLVKGSQMSVPLGSR